MWVHLSLESQCVTKIIMQPYSYQMHKKYFAIYNSCFIFFYVFSDL